MKKKSKLREILEGGRNKALYVSPYDTGRKSTNAKCVDQIIRDVEEEIKRCIGTDWICDCRRRDCFGKGYNARAHSFWERWRQKGDIVINPYWMDYRGGKPKVVNIFSKFELIVCGAVVIVLWILAFIVM